MDLHGIDLSSLNGLSDKEREAALAMLREYSEKGKSDSYERMLYADYEEIPADIETFLTDDRYLGQAWKTAEGKSKVYPFWMERLKELFPTNLDTKVNTFIASGARGLGKSECCVAMLTYLLYRCMCLKDTREHYHLKPTEKLVFAFMNIKKRLAEDVAMSKFQNSIKMSPWFLERGMITGITNKVWEPDPKYAIDIKIGSQADDLIGLPVLGAFFDEISFVRNQDIDIQKAKAIDMIDTAIGGMMTRFVHNGKNPTLLCLASSKRSEKSFLEEHVRKKLESEPDNVMVVDKPVWEVKPKGTYSEETFPVAVGNKFLVSRVLDYGDDEGEYVKKGYRIIHPPIDLRAQFLDNMDRALCDFAGISSTELSKYISGDAVSECIDPARKNMFVKDIIEVGNGKDDRSQYKDFVDLSRIDPKMRGQPMYVHLDMSVSGDMTGIAGVWIKGKKPSTDPSNQARDLYFSLAFSVSVKAPKGRQVSFEKNRNFVRWLRESGFNVKKVTTDSFQSYDLRQQLSSEGFDCEMLSVDRVEPNSHVCIPYQFFKNVIYEQRIEMYDSKTLIEEIVNLERNANTGKVDHPENFRKDVCDAVCGATFEASKYAEQYAYDYGEDFDVMMDVDKAVVGEREARKQITVDFEEMLKNSRPILSSRTPEDDAREKEEMRKRNQGVPQAYGNMLIW